MRSKILNIDIQASENLCYKMRIAKWLIADMSLDTGPEEILFLHDLRIDLCEKR